MSVAMLPVSKFHRIRAWSKVQPDDAWHKMLQTLANRWARSAVAGQYRLDDEEPGMQRSILRAGVTFALSNIGLWAALSLIFNLAWETAQVRLYTLWDDPDRWHVAGSILHCTLGDVVIGTTAFGLAAWLLRRVDWPIDRLCLGTAIVVAVATMFTTWSEWNNVYRLKLWAYAPEMPTIVGIGLSPLLQWVVLPPLIALTFRILHRGVPSNRHD